MRLSHQEIIERYEARTREFKVGDITEAVYRANLFALGYRGKDIDTEVRLNRPPAAVPAWVGILARAVALKTFEGKRLTLAEWEREIATLWKDNQCAR